MIFKRKGLILFLLIFVFLSSAIYAEGIMELNRIEPGMTGMGKTVFSGTKVESFPIEVIDILEEQGLNRDLILIKVGGEEIDRIGGIAAGMSGSPIYIDDKLVGAIGYGWQFTDHHYGLVTPIEDMLKLIESDKTVDEIIPEHAFELQTPLLISGLSGRAFTRLEKEFEHLNFKLIKTGGNGRKNGLDESELEPGSAIAVQLVRGDISVASIGTLTYLDDDDNLLAFGHPFLNKGQVDYLLSTAYISEIIPSLEQPFKLGSPTSNLLGSIKEDRGAGIAGKINIFPRIIPLNIQVVDQDSNVINQVNVQLVKDEQLLTSLVVNIALQTVDSTLDRIGSGTAQVNYKITANGLPDLSVERDDIFYSRNDIAATSLVDIYELLNILTANPYKKINFVDIKIEIEVARVDKVALLQEAKVLNESIKPGDKLDLEVTIHPYRQAAFKKTVNITLPQDIEPGMASISVDGGYSGESYQQVSEENIEEGQELNQAIIGGYKDFKSILEDFSSRPKNNELIIQVYPSYPIEEPLVEDSVSDHEEGSIEQGEQSNEEAKEKPEKFEGEQIVEDEYSEIKTTVSTDYVLEGNLLIDINIEEPAARIGKVPIAEKPMVDKLP